MSVIQLLTDLPALVVVTATRRLSRRLLHEYNRHQLAGGLTVWPTPGILFWPAWVRRHWQEASWQMADNLVVLTAVQSLQLWQVIVEEDSDTLLNARSTAIKAQAARQQLIDHMLDPADESNRQWFVYDADASRWLHWHRQYTRALDKHGWLDTAAVTGSLIRRITGGQYRFKQQPLCLIGFDELTPLQQRLRAWLIDNDLWIDAPAGTAGGASCLIAGDSVREMQQAAHWARQRLEQSWHEGDKPIAVVVPELEQNRQRIERIFREVFYPRDGIATLGEQPLHTQGIRQGSAFNISLGYSLKQEPLIATVVRILSLCRQSFAYEDFSRVLRSPFITNAAPQSAARSRLDNILRRKVPFEVSLHGLIAGLPTQPATDVYTLLSGLSALKQSWKGAAGARLWADRFRRCLSLFGLAGTAHQTGYQRQVMQSLDDVWFEFAQMDLVRPALQLQQALSILNTMIDGKIFQSGAAELPVQILGVLEAAGMQFSSLWVMGMTQQKWPRPASPNPFIPLRLQRQHDMPHCSAQREFEYAARQTQRMLRAADDIVFSYPLMEGEEKFAPSPLLRKFHTTEAGVSASPPTVAPIMEALPDERGPPVDVNSYHASSAALKDQSQCPFRAFVAHRLKGRLPEEPQPGNDPRRRGKLVHDVMELLWQQWQTSEQLHAPDDEQLTAVVTQAIERAMRSRPVSGNREYEAQRLLKLIMQWLQQEKQRQPFEVVSTEWQNITEVNQLKLRLIIDRIDRLNDGSQCMVDYKTGEVSSGAWLGARPDEPQLPLYALTQPGKVSAVVFAGIRAGESKYIGVTDNRRLMVDDQALKDIKQIPVTGGSSPLKQYAGWDAMMAEWRRTIGQLADDHIKGDARVDPKNYPGTCAYCEVSSVCRLFDSE